MPDGFYCAYCRHEFPDAAALQAHIEEDDYFDCIQYALAARLGIARADIVRYVVHTYNTRYGTRQWHAVWQRMYAQDPEKVRCKILPFVPPSRQRRGLLLAQCEHCGRLFSSRRGVVAHQRRSLHCLSIHLRRHLDMDPDEFYDATKHFGPDEERSLFPRLLEMDPETAYYEIVMSKVV